MFRLQCFAMEHSRKEHSTITRRDSEWGGTKPGVHGGVREAGQER